MTTENRNTKMPCVIEFEDGETIAESYRNSVGGYARMMERVAARFGEDRPTVFSWKVGDDPTFVVAGRRFHVRDTGGDL